MLQTVLWHHIKFARRGISKLLNLQTLNRLNLVCYSSHYLNTGQTTCIPDYPAIGLACFILITGLAHDSDAHCMCFNDKQWGFEYWSFEYQTFWISVLLWTKPDIWILDQYIRKQDDIHFSIIQMAFKCQTMWHPTSTNKLRWPLE